MYVGLKYGESGSLENNRLNTHNSTILGNDDGTDEGSLNWWYVSKVLNANDVTNSYDDYVSKTAIYCNDRSLRPDNNYSISNGFNYLGRYRTTTNKRPSFKCGVDANGEVIEGEQNIRDKFSANMSSGGNGELKFPVGLMTVDELYYTAGNVFVLNNRKVYYYQNSVGTSITGSNYWWLASPSRWLDPFADVFRVSGSNEPACLLGYSVRNPYAVRPVISLKSCVTYLKGNGESNTPYEVSIDSSCASAVN